MKKNFKSISLFIFLSFFITSKALAEIKFKEVVVTDSINLPDSKKFNNLTQLSLAPLLAETIKRNHENESISSLFL